MWWQVDRSSQRQQWDLIFKGEELLDGKMLPVYNIVKHYKGAWKRLLRIPYPPAPPEVHAAGKEDDGTGTMQWFLIKADSGPGNSYYFRNVRFNNEFLGVNEKAWVGAAPAKMCLQGHLNCMWYITKTGSVYRERKDEEGLEISPGSEGELSGVSVRGRWKRWHKVQDAGSLSLSYGTKRSEAATRTDTWSTAVSAAVSAGFQVGGVNVGATVSTESGKQLAKQFSSAWSTKHETQYTHHVSAANVGKYLWQWVFDIDTEGAEPVTSKTTEFCYSPSIDEEPKCLPGYDLPGTDCQECKPGYEIQQ
eukprot:TRINITY_DN11608_c0_g1_i1.p1 TRINITY_DN11608_c0_g1~~TRINITY_DN11608_c0_g1_i1.p1  ORF type:complete len:306 (-),score=55.43 TRINITY_DN11608_c0_g1_i1:150-1067(-)